jgi:CrcB protein
MVNSIFIISLGACAGAISRWLVGLALNSLFPPIPLGTLAVNLVGGYCIGLFMSACTAFPSITPEWRLFVTTGFLSTLTTFSAFSAEVVILLQQGRLIMAGSAAALHLFGSLLMTFMGIASFNLFLRQI